MLKPLQGKIKKFDTTDYIEAENAKLIIQKEKKQANSVTTEPNILNKKI